MPKQPLNSDADIENTPIGIRIIQRGHGLVKSIGSPFNVEASQHKKLKLDLNKDWKFILNQIINPNIRYERQFRPQNTATFALNPLTGERENPNDLIEHPRTNGNYQFTCLTSASLYPYKGGMQFFSAAGGEPAIGLLFDIQLCHLNSEKFVFDCEAFTLNDWFFDEQASNDPKYKNLKAKPVNELINEMDKKIKAGLKERLDYNEILAGVSFKALAGIVIQPIQNHPGNLQNRLHAIYRKFYISDLTQKHLQIIILDAHGEPKEYTLTKQRADLKKFLAKHPGNMLIGELMEKFELHEKTEFYAGDGRQHYQPQDIRIKKTLIKAAKHQLIVLNKKLQWLQKHTSLMFILDKANGHIDQQGILAIEKNKNQIQKALDDIDNELAQHDDTIIYPEPYRGAIQHLKKLIEHIDFPIELIKYKVYIGLSDPDIYQSIIKRKFDLPIYTLEDQAYLLANYLQNFLNNPLKQFSSHFLNKINQIFAQLENAPSAEQPQYYLNEITEIKALALRIQAINEHEHDFFILVKNIPQFLTVSNTNAQMNPDHAEVDVIHPHVATTLAELTALEQQAISQRNQARIVNLKSSLLYQPAGENNSALQNNATLLKAVVSINLFEPKNKTEQKQLRALGELSTSCYTVLHCFHQPEDIQLMTNLLEALIRFRETLLSNFALSIHYRKLTRKHYQDVEILLNHLFHAPTTEARPIDRTQFIQTIDKLEKSTALIKQLNVLRQVNEIDSYAIAKAWGENKGQDHRPSSNHVNDESDPLINSKKDRHPSEINRYTTEIRHASQIAYSEHCAIAVNLLTKRKFNDKDVNFQTRMIKQTNEVMQLITSPHPTNPEELNIKLDELARQANVIKKDPSSLRKKIVGACLGIVGAAIVIAGLISLKLGIGLPIMIAGFSIALKGFALMGISTGIGVTLSSAGGLFAFRDHHRTLSKNTQHLVKIGKNMLNR